MMNINDVFSTVIKLRNNDIYGNCVILRPASSRYSKQIISIRNKEKNMYMFNQTEKLSLEGQLEWFSAYEQTSNDIYWCVLDRDENFIGTIRLYGIDPDRYFCEEGSYVIDDEVSNEAPYAVEAKMLALDVAFDLLKVQTVINDNRLDNKVMNNIDNQLGFDEGYIKSIRGVDYLHRILSADNYRENRHKFFSLVEYWGRR